MDRRITLDDIARAAGVSKNTVSIVLRDRPGVSDAVRQRVTELARSMNYEKRALVPEAHKKLKYILVLMPYSLHGHVSNMGSDGLIPRLYFQLQTCAQERGVVVMLHQLSDEQDRSRELPEIAEDMPILGVVTFGCISPEYILMLKDRGYHVVTMHQYYDGLNVDTVTSDDAYAGFVMTDYLIRMGHRRVIYLGEKYYMAKYMDRWQGYCRAMSLHGLRFENNAYSETPVRAQSNQTEMSMIAKTLSTLREKPTGIVCGEDYTATRVLGCLKSMGLQTPEDVSLVGFDDIYNDPHREFPFTTYRADHMEIAESALDLLMSPSRKARKIVIYGEPVYRNSVKRLSLEETGI